ncbi:AbiU2 domain-containing protein [Neorhodopirellula lusitana]|uniref:AbiU2 domain-containing protein n=1 Tax=Neorhodopirellula lusitana TaxID=445327 RepID=UPI00384DBEDD
MQAKISHYQADDTLAKLEVEDECSLAAVPAKLAPVYQRLNEELIWIHGKWNMYRQLFGFSKSRVDLLNESSQAFFAVLQPLWIDYLVLEICKLTDPAQSGKYTNLSIEQLHEKLSSTKYRGIRDQLSLLANSVREECKPLRDRRNKRIAHNEFRTAMSQEAVSIRGISFRELEAALESIRNYMMAFRSHFIDDADYTYETFTAGDGGLDLVYVLKQASVFREMERDDLSLAIRVDEGKRRDA